MALILLGDLKTEKPLQGMAKGGEHSKGAVRTQLPRRLRLSRDAQTLARAARCGGVAGWMAGCVHPSLVRGCASSSTSGNLRKGTVSSVFDSDTAHSRLWNPDGATCGSVVVAGSFPTPFVCVFHASGAAPISPWVQYSRAARFSSVYKRCPVALHTYLFRCCFTEFYWQRSRRFHLACP